MKYDTTYYEFEPDKYEGRYWNVNGLSVAIVASIGIEGAWAAYIGAADVQTEDAALAVVAANGAKLTERDARHFFPEIDLPYRD